VTSGGAECHARSLRGTHQQGMRSRAPTAAGKRPREHFYGRNQENAFLREDVLSQTNV